MLHGIDVSNWQGAVDWARHADSGVAFGFAKASEGGDFVDKWFAHNWAGMRENWMVCGAYHFARPKGNPVAQARHFLNVIDRAGGLHGGDLIALDLEAADGLPPRRVAEFAHRWCQAVMRQSGIRPFVYTYLSFARAGNCAGLDDYPLWIACPSEPKGRPDVPPPWDHWHIHQYASNPHDKNVFAGSRRDLTSFGLDPR